jgi:hypothetical protein
MDLFQSSKILQANLSPIQRFKLMSIADAIPPNWKLTIKQSQQHYHPQIFNDTIFVKMDGKDVDILKTTSKLLYKEFKSKKQTPPTAQKKLQHKYPELAVEWTKIYSLPFVVTIETKLREFQYKLLNDIIFTNEKLFRFKMIESPLCNFCKKEVESLEHLLFYCKCTEVFWQALFSWLRKRNICIETVSLITILFGEFRESKNSIILNHLILMAKFFIYKCKLNNTKPSLKVFLAKIKIVYDIERRIAAKHNKLTKHYKKWEKLLTHVRV